MPFSVVSQKRSRGLLIIHEFLKKAQNSAIHWKSVLDLASINRMPGTDLDCVHGFSGKRLKLTVRPLLLAFLPGKSLSQEHLLSRITSRVLIFLPSHVGVLFLSNRLFLRLAALLTFGLTLTLADECHLTPVIHVLQYPGCTPKPIPSFACAGRCTSYVQVSFSPGFWYKNRIIDRKLRPDIICFRTGYWPLVCPRVFSRYAAKERFGRSKNMEQCLTTQEQNVCPSILL